MGLQPDDVRDREFPLGLRGYDTVEVRQFLAEAAEALHAATEQAVTQLTTDDLLDMVGAEVASVLRTARTSAEGLTKQAETTVLAMRQQAEEIIAEAETRLKEARQEADRLVDTARADRARLLEDLTRREEAVKQAEMALREGVVKLRTWVGTTGTALRQILGDLPQVDPSTWGGGESPGEAG